MLSTIVHALSYGRGRPPESPARAANSDEAKNRAMTRAMTMPKQVSRCSHSLHVSLLWLSLFSVGMPAQSQADVAEPKEARDSFQRGLRVTWFGGDSTLSGTRLMRDPNGNIRYKGEWYSLTEMRGSGGVGYSQLDFVATSKDQVLCELRHHVRDLVDTESYLLGSFDVVRGDTKQIGDFWINPNRLKAMQAQKDEGGQVWFGKRRFGEQSFDVVSIASTRSDFYYSRTYDLNTGFLLFSGSMNIEPGTIIEDKKTGTTEQYAGRGQYSHMSFVGSRQVKQPWASAKLPAWMAPGKEVVYRGQSVEYRFAFDGAYAGGLSARQTVVSQSGPGLPPLTTTSARGFGAAMFDGLWIAPQALRELEASQVLDFDPSTKRQVIVGEAYEGKIPIITRSRSDMLEQFYDGNSGRMVYARYTRTVAGVGQSQSDLHWVAND